MSRIGKKLIIVPSGVNVTLEKGGIKVKGPKGELFRAVPAMVQIAINEAGISVNVQNQEDKKERSIWGAYASHIINMVTGVTKGFVKELEINGVGHKVAMQGKDLKLDVGFSHPVIFKIPAGIVATVDKNIMKLEGIDKELLGQTAAQIREVKKPEPYKGKGIRYMTETIRRKAGKTAKSA